MSEVRVNIEDWVIKTPENQGKKTVKIELFYAGYFREHWSPSNSIMFHPRPPLNLVDNRLFWSTMYRVRINGEWFKEKVQYRVFTKEEIFDRFVSIPSHAAVHVKSSGKTCKFDLVSAGEFKDKWNAFGCTCFFPRPPKQQAARERYWANRYRLKVDGRWFSKKAKYQTFSKDEFFEMMNKL